MLPSSLGAALAAHPYLALAAGVALALAGFNRYQSAKYRAGQRRRAREGRARDVALDGALRPYSHTHGAPRARLIRDGPQSPLLAFTDSLGLEVCVYHWPPADDDADADPRRPRPVIMLVHGLDINAESEFSFRPGHVWAHPATWLKKFCDAGFEVYGFDHHSMGRSESVMTGGLRSQCYSFDDYVDVALQLRNLLAARHPGAPIFIHGQSMGGCVAVRAVQRCPTLFAGLSAACPALYLEKIKAKPINRVLLPLLSLLETFTPWARLAAKQPHPNKAMVAEAQRIGSPMFQGSAPIPALYAGEAIRAAEKGLADVAALEGVPSLWIHAKGDPFVDYTGSEMMVQALKRANADVTFINDFDDEGHDIVSTRDGPRVGDRVVAWMLERVPED